MMRALYLTLYLVCIWAHTGRTQIMKFNWYPYEDLKLGEGVERSSMHGKDACAFQYETKINEDILAQEFSFRIVRDQKDLAGVTRTGINFYSRHLDTSLSSFFGLPASRLYDPGTLNLVLRCTRFLSASDMINPELRTEIDTLANDPIAFTSLFGDTYVSSIKKGATAVVIVSIENMPHSLQEDISLALQQKADGYFFPLHADTLLARELQSANADGRVQMYATVFGDDGSQSHFVNTLKTRAFEKRGLTAIADEMNIHLLRHTTAQTGIMHEFTLVSYQSKGVPVPIGVPTDEVSLKKRADQYFLYHSRIETLREIKIKDQFLRRTEAEQKMVDDLLDHYLDASQKLKEGILLDTSPHIRTKTSRNGGDALEADSLYESKWEEVTCALRPVGHYTFSTAQSWSEGEKLMNQSIYINPCSYGKKVALSFNGPIDWKATSSKTDRPQSVGFHIQVNDEKAMAILEASPARKNSSGSNYTVRFLNHPGLFSLPEDGKVHLEIRLLGDLKDGKTTKNEITTLHIQKGFSISLESQ